MKSYFRSAYLRADGAFVSAANVKSHCRSKSKAYEFISDKFDDKPVANWPNKSEKFKAWTEAEKERVVEALEELPEILLKTPIDNLHRATKSVEPDNTGSISEKGIVIYDEAFKKNLARILAHELSHHVFDYSLTNKQVSEYKWATRWYPASPKVKPLAQRAEGFVQDDGRNSPEEDFANNMEYMIFEPSILKK